MTATCAVFSRRAITLACDSYITVKDSDGNMIPEESEKSKILRLERLHAAVSYWGLARWQDWRTYEWLQEQIKDISMPGKLETWSAELAARLEKRLRDLGDTAWKFGIGVHVAGYEVFDGEPIPEMYLVTNFSGIEPNGSYKVGNELGSSRRSFYDSTGGKYPNVSDHGKPEYRQIMKGLFASGRWMLFNNGDTPLFMTVADGIGKAVNLAVARGNLDRTDPADTQRNYALMVIKTVSEFEKLFFKEGSRVVGGRPHDLTIKPDRTYQSTSGD